MRRRSLADSVCVALCAGALAGVLLAAREIASQRFLEQGLVRLPWLVLRDAWTAQALRFAAFLPATVLGLAWVRALRGRSRVAGAALAGGLGVGASLGLQWLLAGPWPGWWRVDPLARFAATLLGAGAIAALALRGGVAPAPAAALRRALRAGAIATGAALLALHVAIQLAARLQPVAGPNVVLVVVDTLRADHVGAYGYARSTTPHLDAFARDAVTFRNAVAAAPWTIPSMAAALTSRFPSEVYGPGAPVARGHLLLAELFRDAGYATAGFVSHLNVSSQLGFDQGFETWDQDDARGDDHVSSESLTRKAVAFLERHRDRRFFLLVHYFDPHVAYQLHRGCDFDPGYRGVVRNGVGFGELGSLVPRLSARDLDRVRALYDSEICHTDGQIGRLLGRLRELGLYRDALIAVTADHGEEFAERGPRVGHGKHLHQELVHVPLLIKPPGPGRAAASDAWVSLVDLAPTLAHLAGLGAAPSAFRGRALELPGPREGPVFSENDGQEAVILDGWKLMRRDGGREAALYDLGSDPAEATDLSPREPERARRLAAALDAWRRGLAPLAPARRAALFDEEEIARLRALGYAQ